MKIHQFFVLSALVVLALTVVVLGPVLPAFASGPPPVRVPGPGTLVLLSVGAAAAAIVGRFIRRG